MKRRDPVPGTAYARVASTKMASSDPSGSASRALPFSHNLAAEREGRYMQGGNPVLGAISYVLGEQEGKYLDIENLSEVAARNQMIEDARLWGWGSFRKSEKSVIELSLESARQTISASGVPPRDIDMLMLCATEFPTGIDVHADYGKQLIEGLDLDNAFIVGVTLNRCATMLSALSLASDLVKSGRHRAVLVISSDKISSESDRFKKFAIFSDGACSCIVAAERLPGYSIICSASATDAVNMTENGEISARMAKIVTERILGHAKIRVGDIKVVLHNNIFLPIVRMKEQLGAFRNEQMFLDNIVKNGHCFGSDPLINLVDYAAKGSVRVGDYLLLASSTPGLRVSLLLQQT
jgi:3-oxoacyl-[acyl-carrier-protein] synthase III